MAPVDRELLKSKVLGYLKRTLFEPSSLDVLSGGTANFIYRATLLQPLEDGTKEVVVKLSEDYVANSPDFHLPLSRGLIEVCCLDLLSSLPVADRADESEPYNFVVRTPKLFHSDVGNSRIQVQEYLENGVDLKTYALKTYANSNSEATKQQCLQLGKALGRWLKGFHEWNVLQEEQRSEKQLRGIVADNDYLQTLKHTINYSWLLDRVKQFPSVLGDAQDVFEQVRDMAQEELDCEDDLQAIHGDFWTGNVLLPNVPIQEGVDVPMFVIDWEMAQLGKQNLDVGQMIAELYELKLYKDISGGLWMIQGFLDGYGAVIEEFAFRTAIQVGAHLVCFGTSVQGWGTPEQVENVARTGKEIIVHAWEKDRSWFETNDLACLFSKIELSEEES